jgi:hypothetical protein
MNKVKNIALFFLSIFSFTILSLFLIQKQQIKHTEKINEAKAQLDSSRMLQIYEYILGYGDYIPAPLTKQMSVSDSNNKYIKIGQLITSTKYIYHFDETNCFTCVQKYLPYIKKLSKKLGKGNVIIIGSYGKSENLFLTLQGYDLQDIPIYNLAPDLIRNTKIGELNEPYIVEVDSSLQTSRFFIPEKSLSGLSELYQKNTALNN